MEERLRQRWGEQTSAQVSTPAGRLWRVQDAQGGGALALLILTSAAPMNRLIEQMARFVSERKPLKGAPGLLWPSPSLSDPTVPALTFSLAGADAEPLPVFLQRPTDRPWTSRRLCGQLVALVEGLKALHEAGRVHGAVSPLGVAVEALGDERGLRWIYHELWEPLRELGLDAVEVLGVSAGRGGAMAKPTQASDLQQLGRTLAWVREHVLASCAALSDRRWPAPLDDLITRCFSASPPPAAQALSDLQGALATWDDLPDAPPRAPLVPEPLDPRTAAPPGARVALPALGDEVSAAPQAASSGQSVAVRLPRYVGQGDAPSASPSDPRHASPQDPAAPRNPPMRASQTPPTPSDDDLDAPPLAAAPPKAPKDDDEEEPTTMVLSRAGLSGLFQSAEQKKAAEEAGLLPPSAADAADAAEATPNPAEATPATPPPSPPKPPAKAPATGRPRRRKKSTRSDINPENQVISVRHHLGARGGLASQPAVLVLIALLVVAIVLLILLLVRSNTADAQPAAPPIPSAQAATDAAPKLRLALPSRSGATQEQVAVNPAGGSYAACTGGDVWLWSTRAPQPGAAPALLDRFDLGGEQCASLRFSHDGARVYVVTRRGGLLQYEVAAARLRDLPHGLPPGERLTDTQPLRGGALLLFTARDSAEGVGGALQGMWRWDVAAPESPPSLLRTHPFGAAVTATRQTSQRS